MASLQVSLHPLLAVGHHHSLHAPRLSWATALYQWLRVTEDRVLVTLKVNDMQHLKKAQSEEQARNM